MYRPTSGQKLVHATPILRFHPPNGSIFLHKITSWPPFRNYDVKTSIYVFTPNYQISSWSNLKWRSPFEDGRFNRRRRRKKNKKNKITRTRRVAMWDQFLI